MASLSFNHGRPLVSYTGPDGISLNQTEAAKALGVSDRTLRRWDRDGIVAGTTVRGVRLYPVSSLRKLAGEGTAANAR